MPEIINTEYRNLNSLRRYPFDDNATLTDTVGNALPVDFLIDAFVYPIDLQGRVYIATIDAIAKRIYLKDSTTGQTCGYADYTTADTAEIFDSTMTERPIGLLVFGAGLKSVAESAISRTFDVEATALCPTVFVPLVQPGVRSVVAPDGSVLTGNVRIEGQDGVVVTTYADEQGRSILEIDCSGDYSVPDTIADCGGCSPITEICVERAPGSAFMVSQYDDHTIAISMYGVNLPDICAQQRAKTLPDIDGNLPNQAKPGSSPCPGSEGEGGEGGDNVWPPDPVPPLPPGPDVSFCISLSTASGNLLINAPSGTDANAIYVKGLSGAAFQAQSKLKQGMVSGYAEGQTNVAEFANPATFGDGIEIGIRGLAQYKRSS